MLLPAVILASLLAPGDPLPAFQGKDLTGATVELPGAAKGDVTLLIIGFTYGSRFAVEDWAKRFRQEFERLPGVRFYEVPMIGGMARLGKWFIDSGMKKGTPERDHGRVITVYSGSGAWKSRLGYREKDAAYLILLDRQGKVRHLHNGKMNDAAWRRLASITRQWLSVKQ
ncbi:MAG: hypothetical protein KJZ84_06875 [Bryobacteraceae bacterium]|nr:hypothetical protein [Bryobacteraceae bacterium]